MHILIVDIYHNMDKEKLQLFALINDEDQQSATQYESFIFGKYNKSDDHIQPDAVN
jgi:hypothetical protein